MTEGNKKDRSEKGGLFVPIFVPIHRPDLCRLHRITSEIGKGREGQFSYCFGLKRIKTEIKKGFRADFEFIHIIFQRLGELLSCFFIRQNARPLSGNDYKLKVHLNQPKVKISQKKVLTFNFK